MAIIKNSDNTKYWQRWGEIGTLIDCWWAWKAVQALWKTVRRSLKWLNIELPYDPASPFLSIYPREMKTPVLSHPHPDTPPPLQVTTQDT